jgi:Zn-finger nucleic acid-binding protein
MCPSCGIELVASGTRLHCKQCNGMLVRPEEVEEMMRHMAPDQPRTLSKLILAGGTDAPRKCPSCDVMMTVCLLAGVTVDQCPTHGIWFDGQGADSRARRAGLTRQVANTVDALRLVASRQAQLGV